MILESIDEVIIALIDAIASPIGLPMAKYQFE